jgi:uncharacterized phiE125 gp8 family phage protein
LQIRDATGALVDASPLVLTLKKPDGTAGTYSSLTHPGTGLYYQDIPPADITQLGHYQWYVTATIGSFVAVLPSGTFEVFPPDEVTVLALQDAKDMLNITQTSTTNDAEVQSFIEAIISNLEAMTGGPIVNRSITERVDASDSTWELRVLKRPLVSVTSVTDTGTGAAVDMTDSELDLNAGIIRRKLGMPYFSTSGIFTVVYVAGWGTAVPAAINVAARIILQHLWESQRVGGAAPPFPNADTVLLPGFSFAIPNRAAELLAGAALNGMRFARVGAVA